MLIAIQHTILSWQLHSLFAFNLLLTRATRYFVGFALTRHNLYRCWTST